MARRPRSKAPWKPFSDAGLLPDPSGLFLIARAITPPGRVRRFDTRFFTADASAITHHVEGVIHADAELVELVWVEIGSKPLADLHPMTRNVLNELEKRLATGPLSHDAAGAVFPFLRRQDAQGRFGGVARCRHSGAALHARIRTQFEMHAPAQWRVGMTKQSFLQERLSKSQNSSRSA